MKLIITKRELYKLILKLCKTLNPILLIKKR
jgi:hypothetical protein